MCEPAAEFSVQRRAGQTVGLLLAGDSKGCAELFPETGAVHLATLINDS